MSEGEDGQRIDTWLWHARFFKTRSLATAVVAKGRVRLTRFGQTRRITKASATVRPGDTLTLPLNRRIVRLEILGLADRRGPAPEAQGLYHAIDESDAA